MELIEIFQRLGLALGIGLLLGIERGWRKRGKPEGAKPAGVRTITLYALTGACGGLLGLQIGDGLTIAVVAAAAAFVTAGYVIEARPADSDKGFTTELAAFFALLLGLLAMRGEMIVAAALAVAAAALLDSKDEMKRFLARLEETELSSAIKLLIASVLLLPIVPDQGFGPGGVLNPYELWWVVVLVAAIGFAGHAAIRIAGPEAGVRAMGVFGGLISSTALTLSAARLARRTPALGGAFAGAMALAQAVMFVRIGLVSAALAPGLAAALAPALAAGALSAAGLGLWVSRGRADDKDGIELGEPVDFREAVVFAAVFAAVLLGAHWANEWFGRAGLFAVAALSGVADVDALTASAARLSEGGEVAGAVAAQAVAIGLTVNSAVKTGIAVVAGGRAVAAPAAAGLLGSAALALAIAFLG